MLDVVEGWTKTLGPFIVKRADVPLDLTGYTVTMTLRRASGALVTPGGTISVDPDQVAHTGWVYYTPAAADFQWEAIVYGAHQPYTMHLKVVDPTTAIAFAPSAAASIILVHRA